MIDLQLLARILAGSDLDQQKLLAPVGIVGIRERLGGVRKNLENFSGLVLGIVPAPLPGFSRVPGPEAQAEKQGQDHRQRRECPPIFHKPLFNCSSAADISCLHTSGPPINNALCP